MGFATNAIHVGQEPDPATGAIVAPIYQTSTYVNEELGKNKGYDYARTNHPNRKALERTVAKLEGGHGAYVFSSGMAGIDAVFRLLRPGDHVVLSEAVYGGVFRLSRNCSCTLAWNSVSWTPQHRTPFAWRSVRTPKCFTWRRQRTPHSASRISPRWPSSRANATPRWLWTTRFSAPICSGPSNSAP